MSKKGNSVVCNRCGESADIKIYYREEVVGEVDGTSVTRHSLECPNCGTDYFTHMSNEETERLQEGIQSLRESVAELLASESTPFTRKRATQLESEISEKQFELRTLNRKLTREFSPEDLD